MNDFSKFWSGFLDKENPRPVRVAFPDATDPRLYLAFKTFSSWPAFTPVLFGDPTLILEAAKKSGLKKSSVEPFIATRAQTESLQLKASIEEKLIKAHTPPEKIPAYLNDSLYVALASLQNGTVDGVVAGSLRTTADVVRASLKMIGPTRGEHIVSGHIIVDIPGQPAPDNTPYLFADCAVIPEPTPRALAHIANGAATLYQKLTGQTPRVAFLSFSTYKSAEHALIDRILEAKDLVKKHFPSLIIDGALQVDAALDDAVAQIKGASDSAVAGKANIFIFPTLEAANIGYKLVERFAKARVAGPILWGLAKPVSDLSRGSTAQDIIDTTLVLSALIRSN